MAAILCTTIGDLIGKCCQSLSLPCDYCGKACSRGCSALGEIMCTPFMPYLVCTFGLNFPTVVYALKSIADYDCSPSLLRWLAINAAFGICHMLAAFYIVQIIRAPAPSSATATTATISATTGLTAAKGDVEDAKATNFQPMDGYDVPGGPNSFQRIKHVLCYDKGMAVYILVFLTWVVWMGIGVSRRLTVNEADDCADEMAGYMSTVIACGYVWMSLVGMAFCCSLLCLR